MSGYFDGSNGERRWQPWSTSSPFHFKSADSWLWMKKSHPRPVSAPPENRLRFGRDGELFAESRPRLVVSCFPQHGIPPPRTPAPASSQLLGARRNAAARVVRDAPQVARVVAVVRRETARDRRQVRFGGRADPAAEPFVAGAAIVREEADDIEPRLGAGQEAEAAANGFASEAHFADAGSASLVKVLYFSPECQKFAIFRSSGRFLSKSLKPA
ncbi:unnamed protein product [Nesidiocoris tenuis]|uniref:Uncharacterized protein n=1 Tax=Nesidiocoris tenuis TaxID=355587 RepID=A0A6H5GRG7_9HEMI|nr:unnamed protein product [Nesidiocoris tenuis]